MKPKKNMQREHIESYQYSRTNAMGSCCSLFGNGSGPIHLNYVECSGSETDLSQCVHSEAKNKYCGIYHASSVKCLNGKIINIYIFFFHGISLNTKYSTSSIQIAFHVQHRILSNSI